MHSPTSVGVSSGEPTGVSTAKWRVSRCFKLLFGLLVVVFATFQLYPRIEKIHTNHIRASLREQHATFEEQFPVILCGRECPDDL
jgi:hypothetical protein